MVDNLKNKTSLRKRVYGGLAALSIFGGAAGVADNMTKRADAEAGASYLQGAADQANIGKTGYKISQDEKDSMLAIKSMDPTKSDRANACYSLGVADQKEIAAMVGQGINPNEARSILVVRAMGEDPDCRRPDKLPAAAPSGLRPTTGG